MSDERTPADLRREVLRTQREMAEAIRRELETPPDYANERDSEPSVRASLSEPGMRLKVEGEPEDVERLLAQVRARPTLLESLAPITDRMTSPRGKLVGKVSLGITGLVGLLTALQQALAWMREQGLLD